MKLSVFLDLFYFPFSIEICNVSKVSKDSFSQPTNQPLHHNSQLKIRLYLKELQVIIHTWLVAKRSFGFKNEQLGSENTYPNGP